MNINDFLPAYPNPHSKPDDLFDLFPGNFYSSLFRKKEFHQLQLDPSRPALPKVEGEFTPQEQQIYASRYASYHTLYDRQLIFHSMGTGKTALAVLIVEKNLAHGFVGALICVSGKKFESTFINEVKKLTGQKYFPVKHAEMTKKQLDAAIKKNIKSVYSFLRFSAFANRLARYEGGDKAGMLRDTYSNRVIIIDEVHNLRQDEKESKAGEGDEEDDEGEMLPKIKNERKEKGERKEKREEGDGKEEKKRERKDPKRHNIQAFHLLLHSVVNTKQILMTGSCMKDRWSEIADICNLILPMDKQLPIGNGFEEAYSNDGVTIENQEELRNLLKGMVSSLRTIPSNVKREFVGQLLPGMSVFKLDLCRMSPFQANAYQEAYAKDREGKQKTGIYLASTQASNFVFPDGSYGKVGYEKYLNVTKKKPNLLMEKAKKGTRTFPIPTLKPEFRIILTSGVNENMIRFPEKYSPTQTRAEEEKLLANIHRFSAKYAKSISDVLDQRLGKRGNSFIYNLSVSGSGLVLFARLLELFGYTRSERGEEKTPGKRYALLTHLTTDDEGTVIANIQRMCNRPENAQGEYLQVVLGSRTAGEGISFYNVENIGMQTSWWNYGPIDQAIFRGIRYRSHEVIEEIMRKQGKEFKVKIHHYASVADNPDECIDVIMYRTSEDKDRRIKLGERLLKEISYDCANNRKVNMRGVDGSRECDYTTCVYQCEGVLAEELDDMTEVDHSSFNNFYYQSEENGIVDELRKMYRVSFSYTFTELLARLTEYQPFVVLTVLKNVIHQNFPFTNKYGFRSYLKEYNDTYFLADSMDQLVTSFSSYYTSAPAVKRVVPFSEYLSEHRQQYNLTLLESLNQAIQANDYTRVRETWIKLSDEIKEEIIEAVVNADDFGGSSERDTFRDWLLDLARASVRKISDELVVSTFLPQYRCRDARGAWRDCAEEDKIQELLKNVGKEEVKNVEASPYYGIVNKVKFNQGKGWKEGFWIYDNLVAKTVKPGDKRKEQKGVKCSTGKYTLGAMAEIAFNFGLDAENSKDAPLSLQKIRDALRADSKVSTKFLTVPEEDTRRFFRLYKATAQGLCMMLHNYFRDNQLLVYTEETTMKRTVK